MPCHETEEGLPRIHCTCRYVLHVRGCSTQPDGCGRLDVCRQRRIGSCRRWCSPVLWLTCEKPRGRPDLSGVDLEIFDSGNAKVEREHIACDERHRSQTRSSRLQVHFCSGCHFSVRCSITQLKQGGRTYGERGVTSLGWPFPGSFLAISAGFNLFIDVLMETAYQEEFPNPRRISRAVLERWRSCLAASCGQLHQQGASLCRLRLTWYYAGMGTCGIVYSRERGHLEHHRDARDQSYRNVPAHLVYLPNPT